VRYLRADSANFGFLNTLRVKENDALHNVEENILQVEQLFGFKVEEKPPLSFPLHPVDISVADTFLGRINRNPGSPLIGFHPGCATLKNHIMRRWEPAKFIALGKKLIEEAGANILLFGGPEEKELKQQIHYGINSAHCFLTELDNLAQSAALIERCDVFVTNDSSLMHVAAAMQRKTVAIIGPTNTAYIHPWETDYKIVSLHLECAPCFFYSPKPLHCSRTDVQYKCIKELQVEQVFQAVSEYLSVGQTTA
jgi:heptosyltransferase-2